MGDGHVVDLAGADASRFEAEPDRLVWKPTGVFDPREALLLRRRQKLSVAKYRRGCLGMVGVDTENYHRCFPLVRLLRGTSG
jgi:hypothetical protein